MISTPMSYSVDKLIMRFYITQFQWELITLKLKELDQNGYYHFTDTFALENGVIFDSTTSRVTIGYKYTKLDTFKNYIDIEAQDIFTNKYLPVRECIITFNPNITPCYSDNKSTPIAITLALLLAFSNQNMRTLRPLHSNDLSKFNKSDYEPLIDRFHIAHDFPIHIDCFKFDRGLKRSSSAYFKDSIKKAMREILTYYAGTEHSEFTTKVYNKVEQQKTLILRHTERNLQIKLGKIKGRVHPKYYLPEGNTESEISFNYMQYKNNLLVKLNQQTNPITRVEYDFKHKIKFTPNPDLSHVNYNFPTIFTVFEPNYELLTTKSDKIVPITYRALLDSIILGGKYSLESTKDPKCGGSETTYSNILHLLYQIERQRRQSLPSFVLDNDTNKHVELHNCHATIGNYITNLYIYISNLANSQSCIAEIRKLVANHNALLQCDETLTQWNNKYKPHTRKETLAENYDDEIPDYKEEQAS